MLAWRAMNSSDDETRPASSEAARPKEKQRARPLWTRIALVGAAAGVAAIAAVLTHMSSNEVASPATVQVERSATTPPTSASALRREALRECAKQAWTTCSALLDQAKEIDPAGDNYLQIRFIRARITDRELEAQAGNAP